MSVAVRKDRVLIYERLVEATGDVLIGDYSAAGFDIGYVTRPEGIHDGHPAPDRAALAGGRAMSQLRNALADYLTLRRALGYKMDKAERLLGQFVAFAEERGEAHVRTETVLAWAILPAGAAAIWTSRRLSQVRLFATHLRTLDQRSEVPPAELLPAQTRRATPYLRRDDRPRPAGTPPLLISSRGKRLRYGTVHWVFHKLLQHCGIAPCSAACRPRIHDLPHSFAVSTIANDYRTGDPGSRLAILSTYLGHAEPGNTYWYLSGAPELMGLAGERLERHLAGDA